MARILAPQALFFITSYLRLIDYPLQNAASIGTYGMLCYTLSTLIFSVYVDKIRNQDKLLGIAIIIVSILSVFVFHAQNSFILV